MTTKEVVIELERYKQSIALNSRLVDWKRLPLQYFLISFVKNS